MNKSPGHRLLDLLAGWEGYAGSEDEPVPAISIQRWYEKACEEVFELSGEAEHLYVERFVIDVILPALLRV